MSTNNVAADAERGLLAELEEAHDRLEYARKRVAEFGEDDLAALSEAYEGFAGLLDRYEEDVVGDGEFQTFIQFQGEIAEFVDGLDEELLLYETFAECDEYLQQRRLSESDFEHVYEQLEPVADLVARLEERDEAVAAYRRTRRRTRDRVHELGERISELERLLELGDADLAAPVERLREPVEAYNDAVTGAFREFRDEQPARELFAVVDTLGQYPLVPVEQPPAELRSYVREEPPGTEPVPTLLEYADYSRSKLDHYVDDPGRLKHAVDGHRTYLRELDAEPFRVAWPPPPAGELAWRCRELTAAVNRIAPPVVEQLRAVAALPRETDYGRLRNAAVATAELSDGERERLRSGAIEAELREARTERERLREALSSHPER